uniref:thioredoxin-disulfide reductase (NADPH) n=1 Tax=Sus scrofa TaxID=9823 RepID=A0A4X1TX12_PIG
MGHPWETKRSPGSPTVGTPLWDNNTMQLSTRPFAKSRRVRWASGHWPRSHALGVGRSQGRGGANGGIRGRGGMDPGRIQGRGELRNPSRRGSLSVVACQAESDGELNRGPGTAISAAAAAAAALAGADVAGAGEGRHSQPPAGQCPWRVRAVATRTPGPPLRPWDQPLVLRGPRGAAAPPAGPHRGPSSGHLQQELLSAQHADNGASVQEVLSELTNQRTVPNIFVNKVHMGGCDRTFQAHQSGLLQKLLQDDPAYDYDLIVIGGGSGGLACAQEAAILGRKVLVLDFVVPSPQGTSWGLGGTCVNVGCIPKKLMHQAALLGQALTDSRKFGWEYSQQVKHNWGTMTEAVQNHIGSLNWGYRLSLREKAVAYINSYGEFVEHHKIKATNGKGQETCYTAAKFVIATGERPRYLGIQGDKEYCITSDDLFSLPYCPGTTLVVGASYVALECAGFLAGLGLDVTVMVRSVLLRGFDQEMAERVGSYMEQHGVRFLRKFVPVEVQQLEKGSPGKLKVMAKSTEGPETIEGVYNTVLLAIGRDSCTKKMGLEKIGVKINEKSGKIPVNDVEQTNVPYVYAVGDVLEGKPELTPIAVQAGKLLARRLFGGRLEKCDYVNVPTVVFTPLEYGCCGYSEERAIEVYQKENLEDRVIGFHVLGPNAGEIIQGFAAAMKCGLTKQLLDDTIGIHPTCAEVFTTLQITKASGLDVTQKGC